MSVLKWLKQRYCKDEVAESTDKIFEIWQSDGKWLLGITTHSTKAIEFSSLQEAKECAERMHKESKKEHD